MFRKAAGPRAVVKLDLATGKPVWRVTEADHPWAKNGRRLSYHRGYLVCELLDHAQWRGEWGPSGSAIQIIATDTGKVLWGREFVPHMTHRTQARALHIGSLMWISHQFRDENNKRISQWLGLDPATGETLVTHNTSSFSNCTPPVATERFFVRGLRLTDIDTGLNTSSLITKQSCSQDAGAIPANGLIYTAPKHCTCWPMIKSYSAMAPATSLPGPAAKTPEPVDFVVERGPAFGHAAPAAGADPGWPCYRADLWRSASTATTVPANLEVLWTADLGDWPPGPLAQDWKNGFAFYRTGGVGVMAPRGLWTYGQRMFKGDNGYLTKKRPLAAFHEGTLFTSTNDHSSLCRVDFTPESIAAFEGDWHTHRHKVPWSTDQKTGLRIRSSRTDNWLLRRHEDPGNATWTADEVFGVPAPGIFTRGGGWAWTPAEVFGADRGLNVQGIGAVVLAGDTVFVAGTHGRLLAFAAADGKKLAERELPPIVWDGMAAAHGCLYVSTTDGKVLALGRK